MNIVITAKRVELDPAIRELLNEKAGKLTRFYDRLQEIEVIVDRHNSAFSIEMLVNAEHSVEFVASAEDERLRNAVDAVIHKLERQITDHKEKHRNRKHPGK